MDGTNPEDQRLLELCRSAFHAEHRGQYAEAQKMHRDAVAGLVKLVDDAGFLNRERKRVGRKQIKFHTARIGILQPIVGGQKPKLDVVLPTSISAQESLVKIGTNGRLPIGFEELWLAKHLKDRATNPDTPVEPAMQHLLLNPVPLYTPTLDASLANETYPIYMSVEPTFLQGNIYYLKIKTPTEDHQTLYVLQARKRPRYQIGLATLHRATEFTSPCVQVAITGVRPSSIDKHITAVKGRPMAFYTMSSRVINEDPDRLERRGWGNRRFTYAGRQFVWETEGGNEARPQTLHEVERTWPKPGSKTGKKEHKTVGRKLCWGETPSGLSLKKLGIIHMVGGLDQVFKEYLLASQLARLAVVYFGHD